MIDWSRMETAEARAEAALEAARAQAQSRLIAALDAAAEALTGDVPRAERDSWPVKFAAAQAFLAGKADAVQEAGLVREAALAGETPEATAERIVQAARSYNLAAAEIAGLRRRWSARIAAASSADEVLAVAAEAERDLARSFAV